MTDQQLGEALSYAEPGKTIAKLAAAHIDELLPHQTHTELVCEDGSTRKVRVWREQGIYLITMFSSQPKAKAFRAFAAETLFNARRQQSNDMPDWAKVLIQQMGGNIVQAAQKIEEVQNAQAEQRARLEQLEQKTESVDQQIEQRLKDAELERRMVDRMRGQIKTHVAFLVKNTDLPYFRIYASMNFHVGTSKLGDIQARDQAIKAFEFLSSIAKRYGLILPSYQEPFDFGAEAQ